jgi:tRNA threonylcarbamoyl adenosine modification protein (Sua5/YciO/YrdC/YwlC family)
VSKSGIESSRAKSSSAEDLAPAVAALQRGEAIVFPTETLYGLGADALDCAAVEKVVRLKGRAPDQPIPVLVADLAMLQVVAAAVPPAAGKLIARFWPGPLTLVLPGRKDLSRPLLNASGGIGVRISSDPVAAALVRGLGRPLTATSANRSGEPPARTLEQARHYFGERVGAYVDGGTRASERGSTVVEVVGEKVRVIRYGEIAASDVESVLGPGNLVQPA